LDCFIPFWAVLDHFGLLQVVLAVKAVSKIMILSCEMKSSKLDRILEKILEKSWDNINDRKRSMSFFGYFGAIPDH
jgi:hypothetical protein